MLHHPWVDNLLSAGQTCQKAQHSSWQGLLGSWVAGQLGTPHLTSVKYSKKLFYIQISLHTQPTGRDKTFNLCKG